MTATTHPAWCDQTLCTVNPEAVAGDEPMVNWGQHRSAARDLGVKGYYRESMTAVLTMAAAPWPTEVFVRVYANGQEILTLNGLEATVLATRLAKLASDTGQVTA
jgi:hypothetical protein